MAPIAAELIRGWYEVHGREGKVGVLGAAFDARNHGDRMVDDARNGSWREGNGSHAGDMFGVYGMSLFSLPCRCLFCLIFFLCRFYILLASTGAGSIGSPSLPTGLCSSASALATDSGVFNSSPACFIFR